MIARYQERPLMCSHHPHPKTKFAPGEDLLLTGAVHTLGTSDWRQIAAAVPGRNPRQCRERWFNYLSPDVRNGPWTTDEDQLLLSRYHEFGPAWKRIATFFDGRTEINVKSRWMLIQRKIRKQARHGRILQGLGIPQVVSLSIPAIQGNPLPIPQFADPEDKAVSHGQQTG
jgi:hypothetical protein